VATGLDIKKNLREKSHGASEVSWINFQSPSKA
jgi:hypothetical protein